MLRYSLRQLEYALAIATHGSVARAAASYGVAQPSVSASLAKLEDQIGLQLFIRHHAQGLTPSPQGARFLAEARNLVNQANDLQRQSDQAATAISGLLTIGGFTTIAPLFAPRIISTFMTLHGQADLRLEEGPQDHLLSGLHSGRYDLALLYDVGLPDEFSTTELARMSPYVLLPQRHRLAPVSYTHLTLPTN